MSEIAISVENLSKAYRIGQKEEVPDTLLSAVASVAKSPLRNFRRLSRLDTFRETGEADDLVWALRDVSFDVKRGEVVGVIGRNGAGKSTLLKILSRITEPTSGRAVIHGRVSSLLEVGTGFHPELTGRENIYMNGTILGMKKREIDAKFDEIVDFSGVEKFLDTPVKRYSSGMKVRLAFSVAAHLEPEILIIDEVLAVGDAEFQSKCLGKMQSVASDGRTVLFVSHNMGAIVDLCTRSILLQDGAITADNVPSDVINDYLMLAQTQHSVSLTGDAIAREGDGPLRLTAAMTCDDAGKPCRHFRHGDSLNIQFNFRGPELGTISAGVSIRNHVGVLVLHFSTRDTPMDLSYDGGRRQCALRVPTLLLNDGTYYISIWLGDKSLQLNDMVANCLAFDVNDSVSGRHYCKGLIRQDVEWSSGFTTAQDTVVAGAL